MRAPTPNLSAPVVTVPEFLYEGLRRDSVLRRAYGYAFMALSISLRKRQLFPLRKVGDVLQQAPSPILRRSSWLLAPEASFLSPEVAFQFPLQLPLSAAPPPRRVTITHTTKRGSGEPPALVAREPGTGGRAGPEQAGRNARPARLCLLLRP